MSHARKQIRDAAETALKGLTTTQWRVYVSRVHDFTDEQLPGLKIYTLTEDVQYVTQTYPRRQRRELDLIVEGHAKVNDTLDDVLDKISKEVEVVLSAENATGDDLGGITKDLYIDSALISLEQGAVQNGMIRMIFKAVYHTLENDPETAI